MKQEFWHQRWRENQIGFHQSDVTPALARFYDQLKLASGDTVFAPLCGKSLDLAWLRQQGNAVLGVELSPVAAADFFKEQGIESSVMPAGKFESYRGGGIEILCGDFFDLDTDQLSGVSAVLDRAALIALPPEMRQRYAARMVELLPADSRMLLVTLDYPQAEMDGPPFAVPATEVQDLYGGHFGITVLSETDILAKEPGFRERGLTSLVERVYLLQKN